jgi:hypothetical protein
VGLDIYVGTLTRYIAGDWETIVQRWARVNGTEVQLLRADPGPEDSITDPPVIGEAVEGWRAALVGGLGRALEWDETADAPYFTDKPDFDGYGSVQALAARVELGELEAPAARVAEWNDDDAWTRATSAPAPRYAHLYDPELWLPADVPVIATVASGIKSW